MSFLNIMKCFGIVTVLIYAHGPSETDVITTKTGKIRGLKTKVENTEVYSYLGIPYAIPPLGERRFRIATPVEPWKDVLEATKLPPSCMQDPVNPIYEWQPTDRENFSEDCLYLNVWVPVGSNKRKAVMVWIHGGGFDTGSTNLDVYDGKILAARGDVVVVTINYRLGAFGFLYAGTEFAPGNMGMKDQVLALRWINDNIEAFGGDPSQITIFGESVGSISVSTHLVSPLTKGLFSHAILESGAAYQPALSPGPSVGIAMSSQFAINVGCLEENKNITMNPHDVVSCLRKLPATDIAVGGRSIEGPMMTSFIPLHGDDYLPKHPIEEYKAGNIYNVPIMIGDVTDEGSFFLGFIDPILLEVDRPIITKEQAAKYIETAYSLNDNPPTNIIIDYYLKNVSTELIVKRTYDSIGDWLLYCPCVYLSETFATHGMKSYHYIFSHRRRVAPFKEWLGTPHFEESPFVFGSHLSLNNSYVPKDLEFSNTVIDIWASFAKTGKPTYEALGQEWPVYSKGNPNAVDLNPDNPRIINPYKEECQFWKQYF